MFLLAKARRQVKPVKPKKMIRLEGKTVVYSACNSGTSALVTRDGEVYMFGKDAVYCESSTGWWFFQGICVIEMVLTFLARW